MLSLVNTFSLFNARNRRNYRDRSGVYEDALSLCLIHAAVRELKLYMMRIQKDCARVNNLRAGRCDFLVILLTKERGEALLLRNCRPVPLLLL